MKIPPTIEGLTNASTAGRRLYDVLVATPEHGEVARVVRLIAEALAGVGSALHSKRIPDQDDSTPAVDLATASSVIDELFFLHPRGKQAVGFFPDRLVVKTSKQDITIMATDVEDVVVLDSIPKDKKNRVFIMLNFKEVSAVMNGKKKMRACVIQVTGDQQLDIQHPKDATKRLSGIAAVVICQAIGTCGITGKAAFHASDAKVFRSCSETAAVEAYVKARNGYLFPLLNGLCFLESPPIFIHKDKIRSVDFSRANGASATFDFQIHLKSRAIEEFSNISRHELGCLQNWVENLKLPVGFPETSEEEEEAVSGDEASLEEDSDEDFDPYRKRAKKQKVDAANACNSPQLADDGASGSGSSDSSSGDDDDGVELVDEEDMKLSDLQRRLETERETKRIDAAKVVRVGERHGSGGVETDDSDKSFDEEECDGDTDDDSDDGDARLVDEEDLKLSDLEKHL